jgi:NhaP-type Na+/H+ or K+/H+ antiporter
MIKSIVLILLFGFIASKLFAKFKLPGLLGMIIAGIILGPYGLNLLDSVIVGNANNAGISGDIRLIALIIILLRAGLGINKEMLKKVGSVSIKMSAIPCLFEGFTIMLIAHKLLKISLPEAGMLAFIIAAVSPAVVVPSMLYLKEKGLGMAKGVPIIILAGSSIDDIFAITLFTACLGMSVNAGQTVSLPLQIIQIPIEIIGGIFIGWIIANILLNIFNSDRIKLSDLEKLVILLISAFSVEIIGNMINVSGLLSVMTIGFIILEKDRTTAKQLENSLNKIWFFAQIFLFVLIGSEVNIYVALDAGLIGLIIIAVGLLGRTIGVLISLKGSNLNMKERVFCAIAYTPKATVQAAIGGMPLAAGAASGELILAMAVLAIIITAPLGAIGIKGFAPKLLEKNDNTEEESA